MHVEHIITADFYLQIIHLVLIKLLSTFCFFSSGLGYIINVCSYLKYCFKNKRKCVNFFVLFKLRSMKIWSIYFLQVFFGFL